MRSRLLKYAFVLIFTHFKSWLPTESVVAQQAAFPLVTIGILYKLRIQTHQFSGQTFNLCNSCFKKATSFISFLYFAIPFFVVMTHRRPGLLQILFRNSASLSPTAWQRDSSRTTHCQLPAYQCTGVLTQRAGHAFKALLLPRQSSQCLFSVVHCVHPSSTSGYVQERPQWPSSRASVDKRSPVHQTSLVRVLCAF